MQISTALPDPAWAAPLSQHPWQAAALAAIGQPAQMVVLARGRQVAGQALLIRRRLGALVVRGPVWADDLPPEDAAQGLHGPGLHGPGLHGPGLHGPGLHGPGLHGPGLQGPGLQGPGLQGGGLRSPGLHGGGLRSPGLHGGGLRCLGLRCLGLRCLGLRCLGLRMVEGEGPDGPALRQAGFRRVLTPAHVAELDLRGSAGDRRARAQGKWRNRLHQAEAAGLRVRDEAFRPDRHAWLLHAEAAQRQARRYRALPLALVRVWAALHPAATRLFWIDGADGPLAAMLLLIHGPVATYHIGWSGTAGRDACAHHLILMAAADALAARGVARLDLGLVDTDSAPGLARFKIGAGATVRPLGGSWIRLGW